MGWLLMIAAQKAVRLPGVSFVDGSELEMRSDGLHLSTRGQLALGKEMAEQLVANGRKDRFSRCPRPG